MVFKYVYLLDKAQRWKIHALSGDYEEIHSKWSGECLVGNGKSCLQWGKVGLECDRLHLYLFL